MTLTEGCYHDAHKMRKESEIIPVSRQKPLVLVTADAASHAGGRGTSMHGTRELLARLGWSGEGGRANLANLPFSLDDATAGSETELQVAVAGRRQDVDLPRLIEQSDYFANMAKRVVAGDSPRRLVTELERFLEENPAGVWENSWVRFPARLLSPFARETMEQDLQADRTDPSAGRRSDVFRFLALDAAGEEQVRLPVSYLLKIALADLLGTQAAMPSPVRETGQRLMTHYLNDNTSPETFSFHVVPLRKEAGTGRALARETGKRFLLTQFLLMYANERFALKESGQHALIYFAPHPPIRQKELNGLISDSFYRELFMSPCLSGWDRGEEKYRYMQLCHQVLSRSQLNGVAKLREAGIIVNNLVVLPTVSNVSLANNGTHVSLGSRRMTALLSDARSGFTPLHEKQLGDLVIKMVEHFLPLFVGSYSAAPYRLAFTDFHPELALGFLPHELDYTHLRMIWRRWKKKASLSVFGQPVTPFGPPWIDRLISTVFGLKGDFVADYRLMDYLVCLLSTSRSPALDGRPGNGDKLRRDLASLGVFDDQMSVYLLYKLREFDKMGFTGFEGRYYSLFPSLGRDMANAVDLQLLLTALAFKLIAQGDLHHAMIPDDPSLESERRQVFFASAIGIPTFFVRRQTGNLFLRRIIERVKGTRPSRRYPGYIRVPVAAYRLALVEFISEQGADLVEMLGLGETMRDLRERLVNPAEMSAAGRLTRGILDGMGVKDPLRVDASEFNAAAEYHYRDTLRLSHLEEAYASLLDDCSQLELSAREGDGPARSLLGSLPFGNGACSFLRAIHTDLMQERLDAATLRQLIVLTLSTVHHDTDSAARFINERQANGAASPSVCRS